jgi:hypothetical protein
MFEQMRTIPVFWQHFANCVMNDFFRMLVQPLLHWDLMKVSGVTCMVSVLHQETLTTCHFGVTCINNNTDVSLVVTIRHVARLMHTPNVL